MRFVSKFLALTLLAGLAACNSNKVEPVAEPVKANAHITGQIIRYENFPSQYIPPRQVDVWLPKNYKEAKKQHYAVLYMHDGQNLFDPQHSKYSGEEWGMDETVSRLMHEGKIKPTIIVGIWSTDNRFAELMPEKAVTMETKKLLEKDEITIDLDQLKGDEYLRFIKE